MSAGERVWHCIPITQALHEAKSTDGITSRLIMCVLRHLGPEAVLEAVKQVCYVCQQTRERGTGYTSRRPCTRLRASTALPAGSSCVFRDIPGPRLRWTL